MKRQPKIVVIGAGLAGIAMGVRLLEAGLTEFVILEKGADVGGVWQWNHYPGLTCDVPSQLYQYSFAVKPDWSRIFATGPQIKDYHRDVVQKFRLGRYIKTNTEVVSATFDGFGWVVGTAQGEEFTADFLVCATGILHHPNVPDIPGLSDFEGPVLHSARWDDRTRTAGQRIAVIGGGSTGVQLVSALQPEAAELVQFLRTPQWVLWAPTGIRQPVWAGKLLAKLPQANTALYRVLLGCSRILTDVTLRPGVARKTMQSIARLQLHLIRNRKLRKKLTPDDQPFCKRQVVSGSYHRAVQQPNVAVVVDPIEKVTPQGVFSAGREHPVDLIILATGFKAQNYMRPIELTGRDGLGIDEAWAEGPSAYRMTAVPGFPNMFTMMGPNSPVGSISLQFSAELTAKYIVGWLQKFGDGEFDTLEVTRDAADRFNRQVREAIGPTVWNTGCNSWYLNQRGAVDLWPFDRKTMRQMLDAPNEADFILRSQTAWPNR